MGNHPYSRAAAAKGARISNEVRTAKRNQKKRQILELIAAGSNVKTAVQTVGISDNTYWAWRKDDPAFKDSVVSVRSGTFALRDLNSHHEFGPFRQHYLDHPSPPFHIRAVRELEKLADGEIMLMLWPPEHGKTSLIEDFATWKIICDRNVRITVGSERSAHSEKVVSQVRRRLEDNPTKDNQFLRLLTDFGPFKKANLPWREDAFRVGGSTGTERDFTMASIGIDGALQGTRADILFVDDIQGTKSIGRSDTIFERLRQDWFSRSGAFGRIVIVGTRVGSLDVYWRMMEENIVDRLLIFPAYKTAEDVWVPPDRQVFRPKSNPANLEAAGKVTSFLWPERYSPQNYLTMRVNAGEMAWARNFMQQSDPAAGGPFSSAMLSDASLPLVRVIDDPPPDMSSIVIGQDPGFGTNATVAVAMGPRRMRVLDWRVDYELENNQAILGIIEGYCERYRSRACRIDTVILEDKAFQKGLMFDEGLKELRRRVGFRITGHQTGVNKYDPDFGVAAMARSFERGEIELPGADDRSTTAARLLLDRQLLAWRPGKKGTRLVQDLTMALWFCWMVWQRRKDVLDQHAGNASGWKTQGLPWAPTGARVPVGR